MTPHQNIESQIWEYIDGLSTPEERKFIEQLLATNAEWRAKYQELLEFNSSLADNIELYYTQCIITACGLADAIGKITVVKSCPV